MHWDVEGTWGRNSQACRHTVPLWPSLQMRPVGLIWLHFVGFSAPAPFHLKTIVS